MESKPISEFADWALKVIKYARQNPQNNEMPCPKCGENMLYSVSSYNGHVAGRCVNCNLEFMQ